LFNPNLKEQGPDRLVFSTPLGFRIVFFAIAVIIIVAVASASEGPFFARFSGFAYIIIFGCLLSGLYLERWIFDKRQNIFEKNVGLYFLFSRKHIPLDTLKKVILREIGMKRNTDLSAKPGLLTRVARRTALFCLEDKNGELYKMDILKGGSIQSARLTAQKLSAFCEIPLDDDLGDLTGKMSY
jgi:hypothetical protein